MPPGNGPASGTLRISRKFPRTPSTNVVVLSSDDILLYLDWTTLTSQCVKFVSALYGCQAAIVLPGETKLSDVPQLEEKGEALELLMTFVYPLASARSNTADTAGMSFESLMALARLGEKYEVYQALHGCRLGLIRYIDTHALKILDYAGKHGYIDLATKAARKSVDLNLLYVQEQLEVSNFIRWVIFREKTRAKIRPSTYLGEPPHIHDRRHQNSTGISCGLWSQFEQHIKSTKHSFIKVIDMEAAFESYIASSDLGVCAKCTYRAEMWLQECKTRKEDALEDPSEGIVF